MRPAATELMEDKVMVRKRVAITDCPGYSVSVELQTEACQT